MWCFFFSSHIHFILECSFLLVQPCIMSWAPYSFPVVYEELWGNAAWWTSMCTLANLTSVLAHSSCSQTSELTSVFHCQQELFPGLPLIPSYSLCVIRASLNQTYSCALEGLCLDVPAPNTTKHKHAVPSSEIPWIINFCRPGQCVTMWLFS